jgi:hypothetical protein
VPTQIRDHLYIGGEWVASAGDDGLDVINPATEELIATVPEATRADVTRAIRAARRAFDEGPWPLMSPRERGAVFARFTDVMERRMDELISTLTFARPGQLGRSRSPSRSPYRCSTSGTRPSGFSRRFRSRRQCSRGLGRGSAKELWCANLSAWPR